MLGVTALCSMVLSQNVIRQTYNVDKINITIELHRSSTYATLPWHMQSSRAPIWNKNIHIVKIGGLVRRASMSASCKEKCTTVGTKYITYQTSPVRVQSAMSVWPWRQVCHVCMAATTVCHVCMAVTTVCHVCMAVTTAKTWECSRFSTEQEANGAKNYDGKMCSTALVLKFIQLYQPTMRKRLMTSSRRA